MRGENKKERKQERKNGTGKQRERGKKEDE